MATLVYTPSIATFRGPTWAILRNSLRNSVRNHLLDARAQWPSQRVLTTSAVFCMVAFAYALAVGFDLPVAKLRIEHDPALAIGLDLLLLAAFIAAFHWAQRPRELNLRVPYCPGCQRCARRALAQALLQVGCIAVLFFGLWQPLPQPVWQVASPMAAASLWVGYGAGWVLMLRKACTPMLLLLGVCLVEWSAPGMTLGHLVFAMGMTAFAAKYRRALSKLACGDDSRRILINHLSEIRS
jgi:hypothetical protein